MDNQILKLVFDDMGEEAIVFLIVSDTKLTVVTYKSSNKTDWGGVKSQSVLDSYVMENNDDNSIATHIEHAKEYAVSCEEISEKAYNYSVKELCEKQLKYMLL